MSNQVEAQAVTATADTKESATAEEVVKTHAEESDPSNVTDDEASAKDGDEESDEADQEEGSEKPKKGKGVKKRIDKLRNRLSEKDREILFLRSELTKRTPETQSKTDAKKDSPAEGKPHPDNFDSNAAYMEALTDWKVEQKLAAREREARQKEVVQTVEQKKSNFQKALSEFAKDKSDWADRMEDIGDIPMSLGVSEVLLKSDMGPALIYEMANDPDEYKRICSLDAIDAAYELGIIKARLSRSSETLKEIKTTKAPKPIAPVSKTSGGTVKRSIFDESLPFKDYVELRKEQAKRRQA